MSLTVTQKSQVVCEVSGKVLRCSSSPLRDASDAATPPTTPIAAVASMGALREATNDKLGQPPRSAAALVGQALVISAAMTVCACGSTSNDAASGVEEASRAGSSGAAGAEDPVRGAGGSLGDTRGADAAAVGGEDSDGSVGAGAALDWGPGEVCDPDARVGTFLLYVGEDRTILSGTVASAVSPLAVPEVLAEAGSCVLLGPRRLFCETPCGSGQTCAGDGVCVQTPRNTGVGSITVSGLAAPLEVSPNPITSGYSASILDPYPGYEVGSTLALTAAGTGAAPEFTLEAWGVPSMQTDLEVLPIARDTPARLSWDTQGTDASESGVYLALTVNVHGATSGWIECTAEDTGSLDVPAELITQLIDLGLSGFPRATLGRRSTAGVNISAGCVDFRVSSEVTVELAVDGLSSCNSDGDCPLGKTCSAELACVE